MTDRLTPAQEQQTRAWLARSQSVQAAPPIAVDFDSVRRVVAVLLAEIDALRKEVAGDDETHDCLGRECTSSAHVPKRAERYDIAASLALYDNPRPGDHDACNVERVALRSALSEALDGWERCVFDDEPEDLAAIAALRALLGPTDARADLGLDADTPVAGQFEIDAKLADEHAVAAGAPEGERRRLGTWTAGDWVDLCAANRDAGTVAPGAAHAPSVTPDGADVQPSAVTVTTAPDIGADLMCAHGRTAGRPCPHCMGIA